jgi:hypothetical protein
MTHVDLGMSSAKRATWRETDTRPLLQQIVDAHAEADNKELFRLFWKEIRDDEDHLRSIALYWFDLAMLALRRKPRPRSADSVSTPQNGNGARRADAAVTLREKIDERVRHEAVTFLLQLEMPNGKTLAKCTRDDCRSFGGWFIALAKKVPPKKLVADVLSEEQVYRLWQTQCKKAAA